jgi:hypothetical protein
MLHINDLDIDNNCSMLMLATPSCTRVMQFLFGKVASAAKKTG